MTRRLGRWVLGQVHTLGGLLTLVAKAFLDIPVTRRRGRRPVARVLLKQIYFTGFEALRVIFLISLLIGIVIIAQIIGLVGLGSESLVGKVLVWTVLRELGPLLTAIIVIARSGTAITTELGWMKLNGEIDSLESLAIPSGHYLVMPRILGVAVAVVLLTIYFDVVSIVGGLAVASYGWHISVVQFAQGIYASLTLQELGVSVLKSFFFGLFISAACCLEGLGVGVSATQIPQAATRAVMHSLFLVFLLDGLVTVAGLFWSVS